MPEYLDTVDKYIKENPKILYAIPHQKRIVEIYAGDKLIETKDLTETSQENTSMQDYYQGRSNSDTNGFLHHRIGNMQIVCPRHFFFFESVVQITIFGNISQK